MKIFKSIKWRLQIWYGLILVLVLAGFGFTAYQLERGRLFGQIDQELHQTIGILANTLHRPPPRGPDGNQQSFDGPPPGQFPEDSPPGQNPELHLPPEAAGLFGTNNPNQFYYIIEARDGKELARSANVPPIPAFIYRIKPQPNPRIRLDSVEFKNYRENVNVMPSGEIILVGCSIAPELRELKITALKLLIVGGIILIFGLVGGGWLVSRAIKPIEQISSTAVKISAGDLSQRINVTEAESELGQLAAVLKSTFARLESAFAQQKQFASDAAHELRTPVSVMLTQAQTALNRERTAHEYRETVEICQRAAQRMRRLIESLLALARLDAGQEQMKRLQFDFSKTVSDCAELVKPIAEERGVKIISELSTLEISGDSERLAQVVTNLLTNAIHYNKPGGEVRVKLQSQNGLAILTVSDTGAGISAEDLPHVFERFFRADKSRSSGNAGLGLSISKAIIEAHGGTIEVSSEEMAGTIFTIRLPLS
ncbi:MAG TPA: ATP-binding protein [Verrucomicrobiae bacterium]|nr:ATP-binding protein [Verrucomicrobiae bacterium]